jgi:furin
LFGLASQITGKNVAKPDEVWPKVDRSQFKTNLDDEAWPAMWYLNRGGRGMDMNVEEAWAEGVSGKGVVVSILDDGVEWNHPDLKDNYDEEASIDLNDNDKDPFPR